MPIKSTLFLILTALCSVLVSLSTPSSAYEEQFNAQVMRYPYDLENNTVIGSPSWYTVRPRDTLLDIARRHGLGYNELELLFPRMDVWIPPEGRAIPIPTLWVLPPTRFEQLVINLAELRLYFFDKASAMVQTYPIGIGDEGRETPLGTFFINEKRANPTWYIPASLQEKYGMTIMPPGPQNPLGEYIMKFSAGPFGIHGTAMPWGVGRLISAGCIRSYPEHIRILYPQVAIGTKLEIIYEPLKFGWQNGHIYLEAHPDVYRRVPDYLEYAREKLDSFPMAHMIDQQKFMMVVNMRNGVPTNVTRFDPEFMHGRVVSAKQE